MILFCNREHRDYGHSCRHLNIPRARGEYIFHLDDDDYLANDDVFDILATAVMPWAIFPVLREGQYFFSPEPGYCRTTISSYVMRKDLAVGFPADSTYGADSLFVEAVAKVHEFEVLSSEEPLVIIPEASHGRE